MRKTIKLSVVLLIFIFILSNFSKDTNKKFIFSTLGDFPVLPTTPFSYSDIEMPLHLFDAPEDKPTGYKPVDVSPRAFSDITDDAATLGRVLFYDKKLSALENISCGTCHIQANSFADGEIFSEGIDTPTLRNSMHLNDIAWTSNERFFWHMKESTLKETILLPLTDDNEIGANLDDVVIKLAQTSYYPELFDKAFGDTDISEDRIIEAIAQFLKSMNTFNSKFDQAAEIEFENLSPSELRGLELFSESCSSCHTQGAHDTEQIIGGGNSNIFINTLASTLQVLPNIFNNGLPKDHEDDGAGTWNEDYRQLFKIPTLRNIELTGPYMHDGRFISLEEVLDHYSNGVKENIWSIGLIPEGGFDFSNTDKTDIISFLKLLTDESFVENPIWSDPFDLTSSREENLIDILIKPNPMSSFAIIEFENKGSKPALINIMNSNGQLIKSDKVTNTIYEIDKSDYNTGIYFVEISIGDKKQTQKLIVK